MNTKFNQQVPDGGQNARGAKPTMDFCVAMVLSISAACCLPVSAAISG